jgi:hypothetical protein
VGRTILSVLGLGGHAFQPTLAPKNKAGPFRRVALRPWSKIELDAELSRADHIAVDKSPCNSLTVKWMVGLLSPGISRLDKFTLADVIGRVVIVRSGGAQLA